MISHAIVDAIRLTYWMCLKTSWVQDNEENKKPYCNQTNRYYETSAWLQRDK